MKAILYNLSRVISAFILLILIEEFYKAKKFLFYRACCVIIYNA